jgi:hypothetical protein
MAKKARSREENSRRDAEAQSEKERFMIFLPSHLFSAYSASLREIFFSHFQRDTDSLVRISIRRSKTI